MATTAIKLHNAGTGTSSTDKRVGINWEGDTTLSTYTNPSYNLDVNGNFGITGALAGRVTIDSTGICSGTNLTGYCGMAIQDGCIRIDLEDDDSTTTGVAYHEWRNKTTQAVILSHHKGDPLTTGGENTKWGLTFQISKSGNRGILDRSTIAEGATAVTCNGTGQFIIFKDSSNRVRIPQSLYASNVGSYYQASGPTTSATALSSLNTITQVTLVTNGPNGIISSDIESNYTISSGGIKVAKEGTYRITGSIHMTTAAMTDAYRKQIFVRQGTDFSSATEIMQATDIISLDSNGIPGAIAIGPKIVTASSNDIFFLACRFSQPATSTTAVHGSFYSGNSATYLLVERVG